MKDFFKCVQLYGDAILSSIQQKLIWSSFKEWTLVASIGLPSGYITSK